MYLCKSEMGTRDFANLRGLRGIGAILIFYHHFGFDGPVVRSFGDFAVSLFFFLSGLVLAASFKPATSLPRITAVRQFLKRRLIKIYPLYLLSLLVATLLCGYSLRALPFDVLMLQSWIPVQSFYFSGNSVSWFVSSLFFCYIMFYPVMWGLTSGLRRFLGICLGGLCLYLGIVVSVPAPLLTGIIYISPLMQLPAFILGILVWKTFEKTDHIRLSRPLISALQVLSLLIPTAMMFLYDYIDPRWSLASYWWIPNFFLLYIMLVSESYDTLLNRILRSGIMQTLGNISFVFYLFHTLVILIYHRVLAHFHLTLPLLLSSLVCLVAVVIVSYILHYAVELPVAARLKKL